MPARTSRGASFAGDSLYVGDAGAGSIAIARKGSMTTYTGALKGGPNKTITLSATLVDATGTSLAGRTIEFALGAETASAMTDANGIATTVKLAQKNGAYPITATWTPSGADCEPLPGERGLGYLQAAGEVSGRTA